MKLKPANALYLARGIEAAAYSSAMPFVLLHFMENFGYSAVVSGSILSVREMVPIFTSAAMGWAASRWDRKKMLVCGLFLLSLSAFQFWAGWGGLAGLTAGSFLSGLAFGTMRIGFASSVPDLLEPEETAQGYAMLHAAVNVGFVLGPMLSSFWIARRRYDCAILLAAFLYLVNALIVIKLVPPMMRRAIPNEKERGIRELLSSLGRWGLLFLICLYLFSFLNGMRAQIHLMGLAKYFADYFHMPGGAPLYWMIQGFLVAVLVPVTGRWMSRWSLPRLFMAFAAGGILAALGNISLTFFPETQPSWALALLITVTTVGEVCYAPCLGVIFLQLAGRQHIGFLIGISHTLLALGLSCGALLGGLAMDKAIQLNHMPLYWKMLALVYLPAALGVVAIGGWAVQNFFKPFDSAQGGPLESRPGQPAVSGEAIQ